MSIEPEVSTADWLASESALGTRDTVDFVEAWHLSDDDCDDADDACTGRRAACIEGATLCYENWTTPRFPFARLTRYAPQDGFWGRGDVELLRSLQAIINQMVDDIGMNVAVTGKGVWITPPGIQPGQLVGYRPFHLEMPAGAQGRTEFYHPPPVSPATLDLLERFIGKAHEPPARRSGSRRAGHHSAPARRVSRSTRKRICCRIATRCSRAGVRSSSSTSRSA